MKREGALEILKELYEKAGLIDESRNYADKKDENDYGVYISISLYAFEKYMNKAYREIYETSDKFIDLGSKFYADECQLIDDCEEWGIKWKSEQFDKLARKCGLQYDVYSLGYTDFDEDVGRDSRYDYVEAGIDTPYLYELRKEKKWVELLPKPITEVTEEDYNLVLELILEKTVECSKKQTPGIVRCLYEELRRRSCEYGIKYELEDVIRAVSAVSYNADEYYGPVYFELIRDERVKELLRVMPVEECAFLKEVIDGFRKKMKQVLDCDASCADYYESDTDEIIQYEIWNVANPDGYGYYCTYDDLDIGLTSFTCLFTLKVFSDLYLSLKEK